MGLRPLRRGTLIFLFLAISFIATLFYRSRLLIEFFFEDGSEDSMCLSTIIPEFPSPNIALQPQLIPKKIHQIWTNESIPSQWQPGQLAVQNMHVGWEYMLWTDDIAHTFIKEAYLKYLELYDSYPYTIQRADTLWYFVLHYYGGIYLDLDVWTYRPLDPLLQLSAFVCKATPKWISNTILGSKPGHPFFEHVINNLGNHKWNWLRSKYITVMYFTGSLFISTIWIEYANALKELKEKNANQEPRGGLGMDTLKVLVGGRASRK